VNQVSPENSPEPCAVIIHTVQLEDDACSGFGLDRKSTFLGQCPGSNEGDSLVWGPRPAGYSGRYVLLGMNLCSSLWTSVAPAPRPLSQRKVSGCCIY